MCGIEQVQARGWTCVALGDLIVPLGALLGAVAACDFYVCDEKGMEFGFYCNVRKWTWERRVCFPGRIFPVLRCGALMSG